MKNVQLLVTLLTIGLFCSLIVGCTTVHHHYHYGESETPPTQSTADAIYSGWISLASSFILLYPSYYENILYCGRYRDRLPYRSRWYTYYPYPNSWWNNSACYPTSRTSLITSNRNRTYCPTPIRQRTPLIDPPLPISSGDPTYCPTPIAQRGLTFDNKNLPTQYPTPSILQYDRFYPQRIDPITTSRDLAESATPGNSSVHMVEASEWDVLNTYPPKEHQNNVTHAPRRDQITFGEQTPNQDNVRQSEAPSVVKRTSSQTTMPRTSSRTNLEVTEQQEKPDRLLNVRHTSTQPVEAQEQKGFHPSLVEKSAKTNDRILAQNNNVKAEVNNISLPDHAFQQRAKRERAERELREKKERAKREQAVKEKAEKELREQAQRELRAKRERVEREKAEREQRERVAREQAEKKERRERAEREQAEKEKAQRELRAKREQAERERRKQAQRELKEKNERAKREQVAKEQAENERREQAQRELREQRKQAAKEQAEQERRERAQREQANKRRTVKAKPSAPSASLRPKSGTVNNTSPSTVPSTQP